ncbi:hypothetical protein [Nocardia sp. NPDC051833]|uniref:hypothetical protein n=1 Tax=Nocardia sp. NPDC051833 TaxID=3155674 RepID=UPI00344774D6
MGANAARFVHYGEIEMAMLADVARELRARVQQMLDCSRSGSVEHDDLFNGAMALAVGPGVPILFSFR